MLLLGVMLLVPLGYQRFRKNDALRLLGETPEVDDSVFNTIERLMCHLYGMQAEHGINNARYKKFSQGKTPDPQQLPPNKR